MFTAGRFRSAAFRERSPEGELNLAAERREVNNTSADKALAGKMLGISRATLYRKLKQYGIGIRPRASAMAAVAKQ